MREYLVEVYVPRDGAAAVRVAAARARESAEQLSAEGTAVRYVRAIFVPDDETCFHLFEADSAEAVRAAGGRAEFPSARIVQALGMRPSGRDGDDRPTQHEIPHPKEEMTT